MYEEITHFQQMIRYRRELLRTGWKIIDYWKTGQVGDEGVSLKRSSTSKEFKRRSSVGC